MEIKYSLWCQDGIVQGMCGSPMIQQQSTVHKDVTQRLIRKQRPAPNYMVMSSC